MIIKRKPTVLPRRWKTNKVQVDTNWTNDMVALHPSKATREERCQHVLTKLSAKIAERKQKDLARAEKRALMAERRRAVCELYKRPGPAETGDLMQLRWERKQFWAVDRAEYLDERRKRLDGKSQVVDSEYSPMYLAVAESVARYLMIARRKVLLVVTNDARRFDGLMGRVTDEYICRLRTVVPPGRPLLLIDGDDSSESSEDEENDG